MERAIKKATLTKGIFGYSLMNSMQVHALLIYAQVICEKRYNNIELPSNIVVAAACNPYRSNEISKQVYNAQRIPMNVAQHIWNFGSLNTDIFDSYVYSMLTVYVLAKRLEMLHCDTICL